MDIEQKNKVAGNSEINDIRTSSQFKGVSFSKFKNTDVRKQYFDNMKKGKVEQACYWCAELLCAGHIMDIWENIFHYIGKHIHIGNPKIILYLEKRYEIFRNIMSQGQYTNELQVRNNPTIRDLLAEITCVITMSNKKNSFEPIKINKTEEYDITQMTERLISPSVLYIEPIFQKDDPKELFIALNEFAYNISKDKLNMVNACYWLEWIIEFENICKKRKMKCKYMARNYNVENKFKKDNIWIIWDILLYYVDLLNNEYISQLMNSLLKMFCIKYTSASCKKRRYLLYFAISLLTETIPTNIELISDKNIIKIVVSKINIIYKQIKKNEESPNTEYLFANLEKDNTFEQSMRKMNMVNSMDFMTR
jgi:hypothetical protein